MGFLLEKHRANTVVFKAYPGADVEYMAGNFGPRGPGKSDENSKVVILNDENTLDDATMARLVREVYDNKLLLPVGIDDVRSIHFDDDSRFWLTRTTRYPDVEKNDNAIGKKEDLIDHALEQKIIDGDRAGFLKLAKEEIKEKLKHGVVLLGENHEQPDSSLLVSNLIAEGEVKNLMIEFPSMNRLLSTLASREGRVLANKKGYRTLDDYLATAPIVDGVRKDPEILQYMIDYLGSSETPIHKLLTSALKTGVKISFIDTWTKRGDYVSEMDFRNRFMASNIVNTPGLNAPGTIGSIGRDHLALFEKDGQVIPSLQQLAGVPESQIFDLSGAFTDEETGKIYPRWRELGKQANDDDGPRTSQILAVKKLIQTEASDPVYARDKYGHRIVIDSANNLHSHEVTAGIMRKYPDSTLVFTQQEDGALKYSEGSFMHHNDVSLADTKLYVVQGEENPSGQSDIKTLWHKSLIKMRKHPDSALVFSQQEDGALRYSEEYFMHYDDVPLAGTKLYVVQGEENPSGQSDIKTLLHKSLIKMGSFLINKKTKIIQVKKGEETTPSH